MRLSLQKHAALISGANSRPLHIIRCTAIAEPPANAFTRKASKPREAPASSPSSDRPNAQRPWYVARRGGERPAAPEGAPVERPSPKLPEVGFLEDDPAKVQRKARAMFERHLAGGSTSIKAQALGRMGAAGLLRFLLELREAGAAAQQQMDIRVRVGMREIIPAFGRPVKVFVEPVTGRESLPAEVAPQWTVTVSMRTEPSRLEERIFHRLTELPAGGFLEMEMVGVDNVHRGLLALTAARARLNRGGSLFFVPDVAQEPRRVSQRQQEEQQEGQQEEQQEEKQEPQQQHLDEAATPAVAAVAQADAATSMVDVVRFYVSFSGQAPSGRAAPAAASAAAPAAASPARPPAAPRGAAGAAAAGDGAAGGEGAKILVSVAEWEALRGALGSMMEQQKTLTALLEQQQAAAARGAGDAGAGAGSPPAAA